MIRSGACEAAWNMALDEGIATNVRNNAAPPTLRLYGEGICYSGGFPEKH
ncbi:hypothetical protein ACFLZI_03220 [Nitrospirota bacterium]